MPLTDDQLAAIAAREQLATPAPWMWDGLTEEYDGIGRERDHGTVQFGELRAERLWVLTGDMMGHLCSGINARSRADAEFIVRAREDIPLLLAEVRTLHAERDRYRAALEGIEALGTIESMRQTEIAARALAGKAQS